MTAQLEGLLTDLNKEVRNNTEAYIRFEVGFEAMRKDYSEMREILTSLAATQATHGERITVGENRVYELQSLRKELADVRAELSTAKADISSVQTLMEVTAPAKTPWTAIVSSVVAVGALLWTLLGK